MSYLSISIHALLVESDYLYILCNTQCAKFLSTLSLWRATGRPQSGWTDGAHFYPRSPCGERHVVDTPVSVFCNFYPRSPCGERQDSTRSTARWWSFLSTLSLWRATEVNSNNVETAAFLSTLSLWRATDNSTMVISNYIISIHALLVESDPISASEITCTFGISIHALLVESDFIRIDKF